LGNCRSYHCPTLNIIDLERKFLRFVDLFLKDIVKRRAINRVGNNVYMGGTWTASKLTISNIDGSNPKEITDASSIAWNSRWSPDGQMIAFTGRDDPKSELAVFLINADGSSVRHFTHVAAEEGGAQAARWSPDGKRLAFQVNSRTQKGSAHVWISDLASGATRKLAPHKEAYLDETPSWFPNEKQIAFQSNRTGTMEVWVMNVDGTGARQNPMFLIQP
jgi:TolB protein